MLYLLRESGEAIASSPARRELALASGGTHASLKLIRKPRLAYADSVHVIRGRATDANVEYLVAEDQAGLAVCKFIVPNQQIDPILVELDGTCPLQSISSLRAYGVSRVNSAGVFGEQIGFYDWNSGAFQTGGVAIQQFYEYFEMSATGNLSRFIGPEGRLRARFSISQWGPTTIPNWCVVHDQFLWAVE